MSSGFPVLGRSLVRWRVVGRKPFLGGPVGLFDTGTPATSALRIG